MLGTVKGRASRRANSVHIPAHKDDTHIQTAEHANICRLHIRAPTPKRTTNNRMPNTDAELRMHEEEPFTSCQRLNTPVSNPGNRLQIAVVLWTSHYGLLVRQRYTSIMDQALCDYKGKQNRPSTNTSSPPPPPPAPPTPTPKTFSAETSIMTASCQVDVSVSETCECVSRTDLLCHLHVLLH